MHKTQIGQDASSEKSNSHGCIATKHNETFFYCMCNLL